ncbi:HNH endonuclease [Cytobacillus pseudoceanisediminis]|uniref:HNH endonuclease n=1 Tax=Cytobacillus pseudoceanisediminis TaxID=3051614 RepID=UPI003CE6DB83
MVNDTCNLYKTCKICGRTKYHTRFASNGREKGKRKSYCHECKIFKRKGLKNIFDIKKLEKSNITVGIKYKSKKRVFYRVSYEDAVKMVQQRTAGIVNSTLIHLFTETFKEMVLKRDGYICNYCGGFGDTIDHVIPKSKGGKNNFLNCVCACGNCNKEKGNLSVYEFLNIRSKYQVK